MKKLLTLLFIAVNIISASAQNIDTKVKSFKKYPGYFNFYWDETTGKVFLEVDKFNQEFLYVSSLPYGVGSNDLGLDRGQIGETKILKFVKVGPKVLLQQPNYDYRAVSENIEEKKSVEQAFASSIIFGFKVEAEQDQKALIDITAFLMRDVHKIGDKLTALNQGNFRVDDTRSAVFLDNTKNFPKNTEFEAILTLTGTGRGREIRSVTPDADAITVHTHQSFIELPDNNYQPRIYDPRSGLYSAEYMDYATPVNQSITKRYINRHRLAKKDPNAAVSEAVKPIIYYLDRGAPEPIKSALMESGAWWNQAFEAAGYKDAFQIMLLPEGADPMDIRYNLIQWVHRSTRGWSYGASISDPRTGEIIKGQVSLGSLRVRQDFLIAEGLLQPYETGKSVSDEMMKMSIARIRQLSAHEIGHTLGLYHNYAASVKNRSSVMDYPFPRIDMDKDGKISLANAYDEGIGEWDKRAIIYGYQDFPKGTDEKTALNNIINETLKSGLLFMADADARAESSAHPDAHLWEDGVDPIAELEKLMTIRRTLLNRFSENSITDGAPMATIEEALVPIYLLHRYQVEAVSKIVGGLAYTYAIKGDGQIVTKMVEPARQRKAFDALLGTFLPQNLTLTEALISKIPPRPVGYPRTRETFKSQTGLTFDPISAAKSSVNTTLKFIFNPERGARIVEHHARDNNQPAYEDLIDKLLQQNIIEIKTNDDYQGEIQRMTAMATLKYLLNTLGSDRTSEQVKTRLNFSLGKVKNFLMNQSINQRAAVYQQMKSLINRFELYPNEFKLPEPIAMPDGAPIGHDFDY